MMYNESWITVYRLQITDYRLQITYYRSQITDDFPAFCIFFLPFATSSHNCHTVISQGAEQKSSLSLRLLEASQRKCRQQSLEHWQQLAQHQHQHRQQHQSTTAFLNQTDIYRHLPWTESLPSRPWSWKPGH